MPLRQLHPVPGELTPEEATTGLGFGDRAPAGRPYVVLNMVETLDGRIAVDGSSAPLSSPADRELFHGLRTQVDAVMVGAGTVRSERYRRLVKTDELRERRVREGLAPIPLALVVSARLDLPADLPLLQDPESHVVVLTDSDDSPPDVPARVECMRGGLAASLRELREGRGVRSVLCEGGPRLNRALLGDGLVDELFLSLAPALAGGDPLTMVAGGPFDAPIELDVVSILEADGHLFTRWRVRP